MISAGLQRNSVDRALQRLAHAVLLQVVHDLQKGSGAHRADAMMWMHGRSSGLFTFEFCCSIIGRQPDDVRRKPSSMKSSRKNPADRTPEPWRLNEPPEAQFFGHNEASA